MNFIARFISRHPIITFLVILGVADTVCAGKDSKEDDDE